MKCLAVIIARAGSKGIPNKNLSLLAGKPLICHIIDSALIANESFPFDIVFSTDCPDIREVAINSGVWAPFLRPKELAADDIPSLPVVQHAVNEVEKIRGIVYDAIIYLQPTAPLCRPKDIVSCIERLSQNPNIVSAVAVTEASTHPFRMKRMLSDGRLVNFIDQGFEDMRPRQSLPKVYRRAGSVYVSRRDVVMQSGTLVGDPCIGVLVPGETAIDIDTKLDLQLAESILNDKI